jgi:hypothetical protein
MKQQVQTQKAQAEKATRLAPMRRLDDKEVRQVAGGPMDETLLALKKK